MLRPQPGPERRSSAPARSRRSRCIGVHRVPQSAHSARRPHGSTPGSTERPEPQLGAPVRAAEPDDRALRAGEAHQLAHLERREDPSTLERGRGVHVRDLEGQVIEHGTTVDPTARITPHAGDRARGISCANSTTNPSGSATCSVRCPQGRSAGSLSSGTPQPRSRGRHRIDVRRPRARPRPQARGAPGARSATPRGGARRARSRVARSRTRRSPRR